MIVEEIMEAEEKERLRIVKFLRDVVERSSRGASSLMLRAIDAIESNGMDNPEAIASPEDWGHDRE
jgi:hypothetical protein